MVVVPARHENHNSSRTNNHTNNNHEEDEFFMSSSSSHGGSTMTTLKPYSVVVSRRFLVTGTLFPLLAAFLVGRYVREVLIESPRREFMTRYADLLSMEAAMTQTQNSFQVDPSHKALPPPKIRQDKDVPKTLYSSKNFDTAASTSAKSMLIENKTPMQNNAKPYESERRKKREIAKREWRQCPPEGDAGEHDPQAVPEHCRVSASSVAMYADEDEDDSEDALASDDDDEEDDEDDDEDEFVDEIHLPSGQHLLVDMKHVDGEFLNDEQRLAQAMVDVVWESDLTLLSYHCHTLYPTGVSCVGVLLESHISFHTWPDKGVITLDLFTCGSGLLIPVVPIIERLFGIPKKHRVEEDPLPMTVWAHKLRGFREESDMESRALRFDLGREMLGIMGIDMKEKVASVATNFQQIDIYNIIDPRRQDYDAYLRSLADDGSYEAEHKELFQPDIHVFLDGTLQSTRIGNEPYHEALVQPAMFVHDNPQRVAIIGGGEGATLREVLKHNTVKHVKMIEIDEDMVKTSREFIPTWNDCSDLIGSTESCFDDPRAEVLYEDALAWFMDRFAPGVDQTEEKFDVIIMDALDPQETIAFAEALYANDIFTNSLSNALHPNGIIVMQLGVAPFLEDPPDEYTRSSNRASLMAGLQQFGFESMHSYDQSNCGFHDPWSYLIACKSYGCRVNWHRNEAEVEVAIHERILRTRSGERALRYFDGATQRLYQVPNRAFQEVFCRKPETPEECTYLMGYDPLVPNVPAEMFEVKPNGKDSTSVGVDGVGVFSKVDIKKGSMVMQEKNVHSFNFPPSTWQMMERVSKYEGGVGDELDLLYGYLERYGFENMLYGAVGYDAPASILAYANHGCDGTFNINSDPEFEITEQTADPKTMPSSHYPKGYFKNVFNPVVERHLRHLIGGYDVAVKDIRAGEEIMDNFLTSVSSEESWEGIVKELADKCGEKRKEKEAEAEDEAEAEAEAEDEAEAEAEAGAVKVEEE